jgi:hypothetical protein
VCAGEVKPTPEGGNQKIKLKVRINPSGVFNVSSAAMIEKVEIEEEVPVQMEVRVPHGLFKCCGSGILIPDPDISIPDPRIEEEVPVQMEVRVPGTTWLSFQCCGSEILIPDPTS